MILDTTTLTIAGAFVALMASLLLAGASTQIPRAPALAWWAAASFLDAAGIVIIALSAAGHLPLMHLAIALVILSPALVWAGVRVFAGRPVSVFWVVAGLSAWMLIDIALPPADGEFVGAFSFVPSVAYLIASAHELWRSRREKLRGGYGLMAVLILHAVTLAGGIFDTLAGVLTANSLPQLATWLGLISFESLFYSMASAVFMVVLTKERSERRYMLAAREDPLTGIANRRALLEGGERLLRRCAAEGRSFSLIMFDLDRFKWVNDTFGHPAGDAVLRAFASTTQAALRPHDLFGRYGGEEFVVVLPGATIEAAFVIAERIRNSFASLAIIAGDAQLGGTVSAGIASATSAAMSLDAIMKIADTGLYRAKEQGRNRVERPPPRADADLSPVVRVA